MSAVSLADAIREAEEALAAYDASECRPDSHASELGYHLNALLTALREPAPATVTVVVDEFGRSVEVEPASAPPAPATTSWAPIDLASLPVHFVSALPRGHIFMHPETPTCGVCDPFVVAPPAPAEVAERRADVMSRLVKSFDTMEELRRWTNAEIADLLSKHWMEIDGLSAASDLVAEVLDRLRGLKTCVACAGYGYLDHGRCAVCDGTGDVEPAPADNCGALRRVEQKP